MANFIYAIGDSETGEAVLVDPAYAPDELVGILDAAGMHLVGVLATHHHPDHVGGDLFGNAIPGISELLGTIDVPIHIQKSELPFMQATTGVERSSCVLHESGDVISLGGISITCIHTPGHTPGSQCFFIDGLLLSGDTLFIDGCGRTDLANGDPDAMYESLFQRLAPIPEDTEVFPGHAYSRLPFATMGTLRRKNPVLGTQTKDEWIKRYAR
jgi:glyoxylase-like metal-dependent hydrolase (beta-lactamase superfamily II)